MPRRNLFEIKLENIFGLLSGQLGSLGQTTNKFFASVPLTTYFKTNPTPELFYY
jgi:hypothetical protein